MEETEVIIVGAGPSGLSLALSLACRQVKSVVLEVNEAICEDPRAIALTGDTTRIMQLLGVTSKEFKRIGQPVRDLNFHDGHFTSQPYLTLDHTRDWMEQSVLMSILIFQPRLEQTMRDLIDASEYTQLRTSCPVTDCREVKDGVEVSYRTKEGTIKDLRGKYLVGADGKRGIVRKYFLEPKGIRQEVGSHSYEATWIAANLHIHPPTPASHPNFPLWELGYKSEELWDLFFPAGFHFCNHPRMPVAAGRFGPAEEKYWRFEYELPPGYNLEDSIEDLKTQMLPHLRIPAQNLRNGSRLEIDYVEFPWDCVEIVRCRPALFNHKTANRWFDGRTILIGDAAHIFPPFGGQGIANGVRDAFALSWRLALLLKGEDNTSDASGHRRKQLEMWSSERKRGVDQASELTMINGNLLLTKSWALVKFLTFANTLLQYNTINERFCRWLNSDAEGFKHAKSGGVFLAEFHGGSKLAQIWVSDSQSPPFLSDALFWNHGSILTLLVLIDDVSTQEMAELHQAIEAVDTPNLVSPGIITISRDFALQKTDLSNSRIKNYHACVQSDLVGGDIDLRPGYDPSAFWRRFNAQTRFALVRPDFIIFSQAQSSKQVVAQLERAQQLVMSSESQ